MNAGAPSLRVPRVPSVEIPANAGFDENTALCSERCSKGVPSPRGGAWPDQNRLPKGLRSEPPMKWLDRFLARPSPITPEGMSIPLDEHLEALCAALPPDDALDLREERAAILEFEGGYTRSGAEARSGLLQRPP